MQLLKICWILIKINETKIKSFILHYFRGQVLEYVPSPTFLSLRDRKQKLSSLIFIRR